MSLNCSRVGLSVCLSVCLFATVGQQPPGLMLNIHAGVSHQHHLLLRFLDVLCVPCTVPCKHLSGSMGMVQHQGCLRIKLGCCQVLVVVVKCTVWSGCESPVAWLV
jgi:hypothetical protein